MNIFLSDGTNWPLLLNDFLSDGMNYSVAFGIMLLVGSVALLAVAILRQKLGDNQQLNRTNE